MKGLDFWATDDWTNGQLPFWDDWSHDFMMQDWAREVTRDEMLMMLAQASACSF